MRAVPGGLTGGKRETNPTKTRWRKGRRKFMPEILMGVGEEIKFL
jgi:hypothetical protein